MGIGTDVGIGAEVGRAFGGGSMSHDDEPGVDALSLDDEPGVILGAVYLDGNWYCGVFLGVFLGAIDGIWYPITTSSSQKLALNQNGFGNIYIYIYINDSGGRVHQ